MKAGRYATFGIHANGDTRFNVHYDDQRNAMDPTMTAVTGIGPFRQGGPANYNYGQIFPGTVPHGAVTCPPNGFMVKCYESGTVAGAPFNHVFWQCGIGSPVHPFKKAFI